MPASSVSGDGLFPTPVEIRDAVEPHLRALPPDVHQVLFEHAALTMSEIVDGHLSMEIVVVLDTNKAVEACIGSVKHGKALLLALAQYSFVRLIAPREIDDEVRDVLYRKAKGSGIDPKAAEGVWDRVLRPRVEIISNRDDPFWREAMESLEERDLKDVSFVAVYLRSGARAILTSDKDISDIEAVQVWKTQDLGRICTTYRHGCFAFFIIHPILTTLATALVSMIAAFFSAVAELLWMLIQAIGKGIENAVDWFSSLPGWQQILAVLGIAVAGVAIGAAVDKYREEISEFVDRVIKGLERFAKDVLAKMYEVVTALEPFLQVATSGFLYVFQSLGALIKESTGRLERDWQRRISIPRGGFDSNIS